MDFFWDKNGWEIKISAQLKTTIKIKTGEKKHYIKRKTSYTTSLYKDIDVIFTVRFGKFKTSIGEEIITYYLETDLTNEYFTHFYEGCGFTAADRKRNENVKIKESLNRVLTTQIAENSELV